MTEQPLVVALGGRVLGMDPSSGSELWRNEMPGGGLDYVAIAVTDQYVVASASAAKIFCLYRKTGETKWTAKTTGIGRATILKQDGMIFVCKTGFLDCYSVLDGQKLWTQDLRKIGKSGAALGLTNNVVQADGKAR